MSEYDPMQNNSGDFTPWNEEEGGIRRTPAEESELKKLNDPLEEDFKKPSVDFYKRIRDYPNAKIHPEGGTRSFWVGRKLRAKSSIITLVMLLFGGGGFLTVFFTPSMALNQLTQMMTQSLNDQFHAVEERSNMLLEAKLSDVTKGSCGLVKIACRFASMSDTQVKRFKEAGIEVDRKPSLLFKNRGQITEMRFTGTDGKEVRISGAEQLHQMSLENIDFRAAKTKAYNPMFSTLTDKVVTNVLKRLKARKTPITGDTDEERQKKLNDAVAGVNNANGPPIVETQDEDKNTKYSVDGEEISADQANGAKSIAGQLKDITKSGGYQSFAKGALRGIGVLGYLQTGCSAYTFADVASSLGQVEKGAQAARFALEGPLATSDSIKAQEANEGTVNFMATSATTPTKSDVTIDESKLSQPGNVDNLATTTSSSGGKTAFESKGYRYVAYQDVPQSMSIEEGRFMLGGTPSALQTGLNKIATLISPDNPTPKGVRAKCHIINNPLVTAGSIGLGVVLGIGSFGLTTALGVGASVAVSMAAPYFMSQAADIIAGDAFKNLVGKDFGEGTYVGTAYFLSSIAKSRGGKPLNKKEGVEYLQKNITANVAYNETQSYIARATPFDINNRYSFLGSLVFSAIPLVENSKSSASTAMMSMASLIPTALSTLNPAAKAAGVTIDPNYFSCNDPRILGAGANADFDCIVHYGATEKELKIKPVENALWMAQTDNIDPSSENGDPKDNGKPWNYVKFLSECVNRTTGLGVANENDEEDGSNCTDPSKESMNEQFRTYTMNKTINESMDTEPQAMTTDDTEAYTDGQTGAVTAGWSFPTKDDAVISQGFGTGIGRDKNGMSITAKNPEDTEGMPIFAVYDGTVVAAGNEVGLDNRIAIAHWVNGQLVTSVYGHLGKNSIAVSLGDKVKAGQQIGTVTAIDDNTPARLYFEMWQGSTTTGQAIDPMSTLAVTRKAKEITNA